MESELNEAGIDTKSHRFTRSRGQMRLARAADQDDIALLRDESPRGQMRASLIGAFMHAKVLDVLGPHEFRHNADSLVPASQVSIPFIPEKRQNHVIFCVVETFFNSPLVVKLIGRRYADTPPLYLTPWLLRPPTDAA